MTASDHSAGSYMAMATKPNWTTMTVTVCVRVQLSTFSQIVAIKLPLRFKFEKSFSDLTTTIRYRLVILELNDKIG